MPQDRLFRTSSPAPGRAPDGGRDAWRLASERRIRVGTSSWTDRTLLEPGLFYPKEVRSPADRLRFYAGAFPLVELDASYYALPSERNSRAWVERTPSGFVFNAKAFALLTGHPTPPKSLPPDLRPLLGEEGEKRNVYLDKVPPEVVDEVWERFCGALRPLADAGRLGAVLFQFPEWFLPGAASRGYLVECSERLARALPDAWCAVEFRNEAWMRDRERRERTLGFLADHGMPYVCVDMPQGFATSIPPVAEVTAPLAVVRFHGRRTDSWGRRGVGVHERFGYHYSAQELEEWTPRIDRLAAEAEEIHVLMNNCFRDYAQRNAKELAELLTSTSTGA